ncbi:MAG: Rpn family recombination-promoting nuclease/putative transposase [Pseudobutyrivibrio sp.]|nr:Rpn family recombination-promoting nuclease/putative transposase [Pseudobutyrivibrio sp.]
MRKTKTSLSETGNLIIPMTNDYLFKALLQENEHVLRGLLCSLLHLRADEIDSTEITNSIVLGESFTEKTFMLDVIINLNNNKIINLEMQVINNKNWPERSLAYLGREFSKIQRGNQYGNVTPVHQIGILNYTLFEECPTFYSTYMMQDTHSHHIYSDKFAISVLNLNQIERATDEDKSYKIDYWARLFNAKTWEDLNMLAKENPLMAEAADTFRKLTEEDAILDACYRRDLQLAYEASVERKLATQAAELKEKSETISQLTNEIAELKRQLNNKN